MDTAAGTFVLPLSNLCITILLSMVMLLILLYMVSPHGYHTSGVTSLCEPNIISKDSLLNEDYELI